MLLLIQFIELPLNQVIDSVHGQLELINLPFSFMVLIHKSLRFAECQIYDLVLNICVSLDTVFYFYIIVQLYHLVIF